MKNLFTFITIFNFFTIFSQDITGSWSGKLKIQGIELRLVFNIQKADDGYKSTMDSPDQGANGIPISETKLEGDQLTISAKNLGIEYVAKVIDSKELKGQFKQGGQSFEMNMTKSDTKTTSLAKPQEPTQFDSYYSEEVTVLNKVDNLTLSATLTLPKKKGNFPVVILISGSGPQNRDCEILGHKPFLVISDYLTKNGIAVLRFDDRGTGKSTGDFKTAITSDFTKDVSSIITYLKTRKEINSSQIGLIGHSDGGLVASMVAANNTSVSFVVLLAAPGVKGSELLLKQQALIGLSSGVSVEEIAKSQEENKKVFDLIITSTDQQKLISDITSLVEEGVEKMAESDLPNGMTKKDFVSFQLQQITSPWMISFIKSNPSEYLQQIKCPVLALNGMLDLQVAYKENLSGIENALKAGENNRCIIKGYEGLNHLFQHALTGNPSEYATIQETFSEEVLKDMLEWIKGMDLKN